LLGDATEVEGAEVGNFLFATYVSLTSVDIATVTVYPKKIPKTVIGISNLAIRFLILTNKYRSKVTPSTQPICGRALKVKIIENKNPQVADKECFLFKCRIRNNKEKAEIVQN
jgi:hypothetical protein